jgi:hypothetical protein
MAWIVWGRFQSTPKQTPAKSRFECGDWTLDILKQLASQMPMRL